jgi:hypothetical protein
MKQRGTRRLVGSVAGVALVVLATACGPAPKTWTATTPAPVPDANYQPGEASAVDCATPLDCAAVGQQLIAAYDGDWKTVASPPRRFQSLSCPPDGSGCIAITDESLAKVVRLPDTVVHEVKIQNASI